MRLRAGMRVPSEKVKEAMPRYVREYHFRPGALYICAFSKTRPCRLSRQTAYHRYFHMAIDMTSLRLAPLHLAKAECTQGG